MGPLYPHGAADRERRNLGWCERGFPKHHVERVFKQADRLALTGDQLVEGAGWGLAPHDDQIARRALAGLRLLHPVMKAATIIVGVDGEQVRDAATEQLRQDQLAGWSQRSFVHQRELGQRIRSNGPDAAPIVAGLARLL